MEPRSRSLYCVVHKAASTTWMSLFARVYRAEDEDFVERMEKSGAYYKSVRGKKAKAMPGRNKSYFAHMLYLVGTFCQRSYVQADNL